MPEHIGCVLVHQTLRGVWDAVDRGESGTQVSEQKWNHNGRELCILVQHPKALIYLLLYTVTNSRCWGCILQYIHGWHLTRRSYLIAVPSWLTRSSWQSQMAGSWRGIFMMILVIFPIFASCIFCVTFDFIDNSAVRSFPYAIFICYLGGFLFPQLSLTYSSHFLTVGIPQDSVFRPLTLLTVWTFFICVPLSTWLKAANYHF